jgi:DnaJ family protein C protein 10
MWFVNFYSPQCSHCHHLAPVWRKLAKKLEGVIRIGAVNCEDDWRLCSQVGIQSYPTLLYYQPVIRFIVNKYNDLLTYTIINYDLFLEFKARSQI